MACCKIHFGLLFAALLELDSPAGYAPCASILLPLRCWLSPFNSIGIFTVNNTSILHSHNDSNENKFYLTWPFALSRLDKMQSGVWMSLSFCLSSLTLTEMIVKWFTYPDLNAGVCRSFCLHPLSAKVKTGKK